LSQNGHWQKAVLPLQVDDFIFLCEVKKFLNKNIFVRMSEKIRFPLNEKIALQTERTLPQKKNVGTAV
jgi:hypothetical protein